MKQRTILMAMACLLFSAAAAFAQTKTDFSGVWTLDVSKSKLDERARIESGTMTVTQTSDKLTVESNFKRTPRPDNNNAGGGNANTGGTGMGQGNGGGMRAGGGAGRGGMGGGQPVTYTLDGKETTSEVGGGQMTGTVKMQAAFDGSKLNLTSARSFTTQNGEVTMTTKETWETVDGGKALKVTRSIESPRGTQTSEMYFTRK